MTTLVTLTVAITILLAVGILLDEGHLSGKTKQRIRETLIWFFLGLARVQSRSLQLWPWQLLRTMVRVGLIAALVAVAGFCLSTRAHHRLTEAFGNAIIGQALVVIVFCTYLLACIAAVVNVWGTLSSTCTLILCAIVSAVLAMQSRIGSVLSRKPSSPMINPFSHLAGLLAVFATGVVVLNKLLG